MQTLSHVRRFLYLTQGQNRRNFCLVLNFQQADIIALIECNNFCLLNMPFIAYIHFDFFQVLSIYRYNSWFCTCQILIDHMKIGHKISRKDCPGGSSIDEVYLFAMTGSFPCATCDCQGEKKYPEESFHNKSVLFQSLLHSWKSTASLFTSNQNSLEQFSRKKDMMHSESAIRLMI